jgi:uncharacterized paraquat-inducible protein A
MTSEASNTPEHCPICGVAATEEKALRCDSCGSRRRAHDLGQALVLPLALAGLFLAAPAWQAPFVIVRKFGTDHVTRLGAGFDALQEQGMPLLASWVLVCGAFVPITLLGLIVARLLPEALGRRPLAAEVCSRAARILGDWLMPEVQVLAVLVAFVKLGTLVHVQIGPGFWCYAAMSLAALIAWSQCHPTEADLPRKRRALVA